MSTPYRLRGENNQLLTASLFVEIWEAQNEQFRSVVQTPVFSLGDREGYINCRKTFIEFKDPTGAKWAEAYLEGVHHLNKLLGSTWFRDAFEDWVAELETLLQSEALEKIRAIASSSSPAAFQAAKYLAGREWKKEKKGRPSKEAVRGALKREVDKLTQEDEDMARISPRLTVVR